MRKRIVPFLLVIAAALLDTAVIPVALDAPWVVSLTLMTVIALAMLRGRTMGILYGLVGGLMIDVTAGTLGETMAPMIAAGFLTGLLVYESDPRRLREISRQRMRTRRLVCALALTFVIEAVVLFYQYFNTAILSFGMILTSLIRTVIASAGVMLVLPVAGRLSMGGAKRAKPRAQAREVKNF